MTLYSLEGGFVILFTYFIFRSNESTFNRTALSEERRTLRKRRHLVNLQMTFVSWCLEFAMGLLILLRMFIFWATGV